jgi:YHS domain-containing protein
MVSVIRVHARGEDHRVVQLVGNLFVCSRANGSCCCGWDEKGRTPFDNELWSHEWEKRAIRNRIHLTFTGCLGPCMAGNNAMLQIYGHSIWLNDLNAPAIVPQVFDYIEEVLRCGEVVEAPEGLRGHVIARYVGQGGDSEDGVLDCDGIDPVCLMTVDPVTAGHRVEHDGRTIYFCAPSCRKLFLANPAAYLSVG